MNPEIELVKKWLADPESVSAEELKRAADAAHADATAVSYAAAVATADAADAAAYADATAVSYAADAAATAAAHAADEDAANIAVDAKYWVNHVKYWVKRYEELTK